MRSVIYVLTVTLVLLCTITGCHSDKRQKDTRWKPWSETSDDTLPTSAIARADSANLSADSSAKADSSARADSAAVADSLRHASPRGTHYTLSGRAGDKDVYLNFSTINGSHLIGNAIVDGKTTEITGTTEQTGNAERIHITEPRAMRDSTRFRIEVTSTATGYEGSYTEGDETHHVVLQR